MMKNRVVYLLVILAVLFCGLWGGTRLAPVLFAVLLVLPLLSAAGLYGSVHKLSLRLQGEHICRSGQAQELQITVSSPFFHPIGKIQLLVYLENRVFGTKKEEMLCLEMGRGRQHSYTVLLDTSVCGAQVLEVREMLCTDLLGLFSFRKWMKEEFSYTVYPYEAQIYISLYRQREREQPGDIYDGKKSGTDISEVFGLREYREGDPLQSIHWKLSGKMKQLIVREFGRPVNYHTLLLLSPAFHYGNQEVEEAVVSAVFDLGISVSRALLNQNMAHFVGYAAGGSLFCSAVDSLHSYEEMLLTLMHHPVQKNGDETLLSFISQQMYRQYTKVVYVTGAVNEMAAQNLSVLADLTVLLAAEGQSGYLVENAGYTLVRIAIEKIRKTEHSIPI